MTRMKELSQQKSGGLGRDHWPVHARQWSKVGPPLRPCREDIELLERLVEASVTGVAETSRHAVLLGVTPEIATMAWPAGTRLTAFDHNRGMIESVWPVDRITCEASIREADWRSIPVADRSVAVIVGDGCYSMLAVHDYDRVSSELTRILKPDGGMIMRFFVGPEEQESPEDVFADLSAGRIGNFHVFKWRLAMSLTSGADFAVRVGDICAAWDSTGLDVESLFDRLGWSTDVITTLTVYRDSDVRFTYPTLTEMRRRLTPFFEERGVFFPAYELGERCPTLLLASSRR